MSETTVTRMDALEIAEFLETQRTGVLSMADGDEGYGVPLSFTFEEDDHDVYFRMGYGPDSTKRRFVESGGDVSFVVVDETEAGWKSVIARGELEVLAHDSLGSAVVESARELDIPYYRVHDQPAGEMTFNVVRLAATELSGIVEG